MDALNPPQNVLIKLGTIMVHAADAFGPKGTHTDIAAINRLLADDELQEWWLKMDKLALLPIKREG